MIEYGIKALQATMLVYCGVLVWGGFSSVMGAPVPEVEFVAPPSVESKQQAFPRYAVIPSRNIFQTVLVAPALPEPQEELVESQLPITVVGVVSTDGTSCATVKSSSGPTGVFCAGDMMEGIAPGVRLERVEPRRLVVSKGGKREALLLKVEESKRSIALLRSGRKPVVKVQVFGATPEPVGIGAVAEALPVEQVRRPERRAPRPSRPPTGVGAPTTVGTRELDAAAYTQVVDSATVRAIVGREFEREPVVRDFSAVAGPTGAAEGRGPAARRQATRRQSAGAEVATGPAGDLVSVSSFSAIAGQTLLEGLRDKIDLKDGERVVAVNGISVDDTSRLPDLIRSLTRSGPTSLRISVNSNAEREVEVNLP